MQGGQRRHILPGGAPLPDDLRFHKCREGEECVILAPPLGSNLRRVTTKHFVRRGRKLQIEIERGSKRLFAFGSEGWIGGRSKEEDCAVLGPRSPLARHPAPVCCVGGALRQLPVVRLRLRRRHRRQGQPGPAPARPSGQPLQPRLLGDAHEQVRFADVLTSFSFCCCCCCCCCFWCSFQLLLLFSDIAVVADIVIAVAIIAVFNYLCCWCQWMTFLSREQSHKSYRPLTVLTFRWNLLLSGGVLVPSHFHLVNVLLHALVVALLHRLLLSILGGTSKRGRRIAAVASALFAAHPVRNTYTHKYCIRTWRQTPRRRNRFQNRI